MTGERRTSDSFSSVTGLEWDDHKIPVTRVSSRRQREGYVPKFPLRILTAVMAAKDEKALPLILAIHRQLHMTGRESTPLNGAIWDAIGSPSEKQRAAILRKLRALPGIIRITPQQTPASYYRVAKGSLWSSESGQ
jgi:hypothetical protein